MFYLLAIIQEFWVEQFLLWSEKDQFLALEYRQLRLGRVLDKNCLNSQIKSHI